jgi:hypothetical protein
LFTIAFLVIKDAYVTVNSADLSDHVKSVQVNYKAEILEDTAMGADTKSRVAGLKDWSIDLEFFQDYASSKVDATLWGLVGAAAFGIKVNPIATAVSTTQPSFSGNCVLGDYSPVSGAVGELSMVSVSFAGDGDLTRTTS